MFKSRKIFIVVAGGNYAAERHFDETIKHKRTLNEVRNYLPQNEINNLENIYHSSPFIVWGAVPGPQNEIRWEKMSVGDVVLIYNNGYIHFAGEVGAKVRSKELAKYFWQETNIGQTWELIYFIVNEEKVSVPLNKLNPLFGYKENYSPQGFTMVNEEATNKFLLKYGDILGTLNSIEKGEEIIEIPSKANLIKDITEQVERSTTEHDEMQWRLIRLGELAKFDIWVPANDQGKSYSNNYFREHVLPEFHESLDVPPSIRNIDVVWKYGPYSIKSAFEIEHSTSVYSGILRLSDLRAETPNSNYPLFIVASDERKRKVFDELSRPTFSGSCLRLNEVVRFLSYRDIRSIDESVNETTPFDPNLLFSSGELVH
jgi:hypothetical protein